MNLPEFTARRPEPRLRVMLALMLREMAASHGRTPGGYVWSIIEPVAGIAILTLAFSFFLHRPPLGTSFALFFATAYLPFAIYAGLSGKVAQALAFSRPMFAFPVVGVVDAIAARFALNLLTQIAVLVAVMLGIHAIYGLRLQPDWPAILLAVAMAAALGLGLGVLNCALRGLLPVWDLVWAVLNRPLLLCSGVFYLMEHLPAGARAALWYNPLIHVVGEMRRGFYPGYQAAYVSPAYVCACALVPLALGLLILKRAHRDILTG